MSVKGRGGWSLIELTIILVVLSILAAILAPVMGRYVRNAKVVRAREDVQALGSAMVMYIEDTANSYFFIAGGTGTTRPDQGSGNRVDVLISDGDIPEVEAGVTEIFWSAPPGSLAIGVDFFSDHLIANAPAYRTPTDLVNNAATTNTGWSAEDNNDVGFNAEFAWRGPYITGPILPDPWGNRYASNVIYLNPRADTADATATANGYEEDVVVISAGPDEEIDTDDSVDGLVPGDDDILYTVSGNSRP